VSRDECWFRPVRGDMRRPVVFISKIVRPQVLERLQQVADVRPWLGPGRCPADALRDHVREVDAVLGTDHWTAELMDQASRLRLIALTSVGVDKVDVHAATERGILVTNTPDVLTETTADLTFALLLGAARRITELERWLRTGHWRIVGETPMGHDVHHRTIGVIGLGRIGVAVARRALGFGMRVLYFNKTRRMELEAQYPYVHVELTRLLRESDFIVLCVPLSPDTRAMLGREELKLVKPTAIIVNATRGAVIDESALIEALQQGRIAAAGLDVFEKEPVPLTNPLLAMDNVVTLPHVGSATEATRQAMVDLAVENILAVLNGGRALTPVNNVSPMADHATPRPTKH